MSKVSKELRERMKRHNLKQWEVAAKLGVGENTLIRWMRGEPSEEHARMIGEAIEELSEGEV